jgi:AAA+ ATPase superfamily predicted ATPase
MNNNDLAREYVSLREYLERLMEEREKRLEEYKNFVDRALKIAVSNIETRLEKLNELRGNTVDRSEFMVEMKMIETRLEAIERWQAKLIGVGIVLTLLAGGLGALIMKLVG